MGKRSKKEKKREKQMNADYGRFNYQQTPATSVLPVTNGEPKIRYLSKVYKILEADGFVGYKEDPGEILPERKPMNHWKGAKIPWSVLDQIKAYFEWSQATTSSEVTMRLFHNRQTGEWKPWAFPQERGGGMSAKEIGDHPLYTVQRNEIGLGFECMGSIHHHCKASAFQSSTDLSDEQNWCGIHFTLGHIGEAKYDVHVRCIVGDVQSPIALNELFDLDDRAKAIIPPGMWDELIKYWVCQPPEESVTFPDVWKSNLVLRAIVTTPKQEVWTPGQGHYSSSPGPGLSGSKNFGGPTWDLVDLDGLELDEDKLMESFVDWCEEVNMDWIEALVWLIRVNYSDVPVVWFSNSGYTPPPLPLSVKATKSKAADNIEVPKDEGKTYGTTPAVASHLHGSFNDMLGCDDDEVHDEATVWERLVDQHNFKNPPKGSSDK